MDESKLDEIVAVILQCWGSFPGSDDYENDVETARHIVQSEFQGEGA